MQTIKEQLMNTAFLTPAAAFYVRASEVLGHGHALQTGSMRFNKEQKIVEVFGWPTIVPENVGPRVKLALNLTDVHLLHQYFGRLSNIDNYIGGLQGWEEKLDADSVTYSHRTGSGRLELYATRDNNARAESYGMKVYKPENELICHIYKHWYLDKYGWMIPQRFNEKELRDRPDRLSTIVDIFYGDYTEQSELDDHNLLDIPVLGEVLRQQIQTMRKSREEYIQRMRDEAQQ